MPLGIGLSKCGEQKWTFYQYVIKLGQPCKNQKWTKDIKLWKIEWHNASYIVNSKYEMKHKWS